MSAVWELDLPRDQKLVLMAFADHADDEGYTYPSLARVAWKCGYAQTRSVADIVKRLIETETLILVERAHGRTPTLYQVRPHSGEALPPFDPARFKTDRGAENAPQAPEGDTKSLNGNVLHPPENARGAENAPQFRRGSKNAPQRPVDNSVGVRSAPVGVRFPTRRGAVASAPEPINHIEPIRAPARARGSPGSSPVPSQERIDPELRKLNNSAMLLEIDPKRRDETLDDFRRRIDVATRRKLDQQHRERLEAKAREETASAAASAGEGP